MNVVSRILIALVVFVVAWLVIWLVATILAAVPTAPTVWLGHLLDQIAVLVALLIAVFWFVTGRSLSWRG